MLQNYTFFSIFQNIWLFIIFRLALRRFGLYAKPMLSAMSHTLSTVTMEAMT